MTKEQYIKAKALNAKMEQLNEEIKILQSYVDNKKQLIIEINKIVPDFSKKESKTCSVTINQSELEYLIQIKTMELFETNKEFQEI